MSKKKIDMIEEAARKRAKNFYYNNPQIKTVKILNKETKESIKCPECENLSFKIYQKIGGVIIGNRNKVISNKPTKYVYICKCGIRLILPEDDIEFVKIKYGCAAQKCPYGLQKMNKDCLKCKYVYEK